MLQDKLHRLLIATHLSSGSYVLLVDSHMCGYVMLIAAVPEALNNFPIPVALPFWLVSNFAVEIPTFLFSFLNFVSFRKITLCYL